MKDLSENKKLVYTAFSKKNFFWRMHISKYVLENNCVPVNPFMNFEYFLLDTVDRDLIRNGNTNIIKKCDEIWIFGEISDGVMKEIKLAKEIKKPVKYFDISNLPNQIKEISEKNVKYEVE